MYSLENLHNIEVLVFSKNAFSLEVLMTGNEAPRHFVSISLTTHEIILAIAAWEKCFGFMLHPENPKTHVSFAKLAPGSWRVVLQGSKGHILELLHATNFEVIRFLVADINSHIQTSDDDFLGYSIRVPLTRISCKIDIFIKEIVDAPSIVPVNALTRTQSYKIREDEVKYSSLPVSSTSQSQSFKNDTMVSQNNQKRPQALVLPLSFVSPQQNEEVGLQFKSFLNVSVEGSPTLTRVPLRSMKISSQVNENARAYVSEGAPQITETIRLAKNEVSAIIGPQGKRINLICNATHCRISVSPVTLETMNSRFRTQDFPQIISVTGKPQGVAQAKIMLRRALLEYRSK